MEVLDKGFSRSQRLLTPADYRRVFDKPLKSIDQHFIVMARQNGRGYPRLGLALAKKKVKKAVDRNSLKRLARESFRHHKGKLVDLDIIVMANRINPMLDKKQLSQSLQQHWRKLVKRL